MDDLVKRLRAKKQSAGLKLTKEDGVRVATLKREPDPDCVAAADHIEALEREVTEHTPIVEERDRLIQHLKDQIKVRDLHISAARREALEEAARYFEQIEAFPVDVPVKNIAAAIRALKEGK
jgi:hypothetical protein